MKNNLSLYRIADEYRTAMETLMELDIDERTFFDTLESLQGEFKDKAINLTYAIRNLDSIIESIKDAEKQMYHRRAALQKKSDHIRQYLISCMENAQILSIDDCADFSVKVRLNPASLDITNESEIPPRFWYIPTPVPIIDKVMLKSTLKNGEKISGAQLIYNKSLQIK